MDSTSLTDIELIELKKAIVDRKGKISGAFAFGRNFVATHGEIVTNGFISNGVSLATEARKLEDVSGMSFQYSVSGTTETLSIWMSPVVNDHHAPYVTIDLDTEANTCRQISGEPRILDSIAGVIARAPDLIESRTAERERAMDVQATIQEALLLRVPLPTPERPIFATIKDYFNGRVRAAP